MQKKTYYHYYNGFELHVMLEHDFLSLTFDLFPVHKHTYTNTLEHFQSFIVAHVSIRFEFIFSSFAAFMRCFFSMLLWSFLLLLLFLALLVSMV